jgi:flagellin
LSALVSSLIFNQLLNAINRNPSGLYDSLKPISSGRKLNGAVTPNPAANALSTQLKSYISAPTQSVRNPESSENFILTAEDGLAVVADLLNQLRQMTIQFSNGNLNNSQRETLG